MTDNRKAKAFVWFQVRQEGKQFSRRCRIGHRLIVSDKRYNKTMNQDPPIALVTGASSGIGAATTQLLLEDGYVVVGASRQKAALDALGEESGNRFVPLVLDVNDDHSVSTLFDRLPPAYQWIDVLVNNAGHDIGGRRRFDKGSLAQWTNIIETNLSGVVRVTHEVIGRMVERGAGHIVNMGSVAGLQGYASGTIYSASKHAVHGFSESLRMDYAGSGIRVTEILPGLVKTQFAANRFSYEEGNEEIFLPY